MTVKVLENYPIQVSFPVHWGEMDAFEHLNNAVYFRYFETARIAYFQAMGIVGKNQGKIAPILASTKCKFIFPLAFPDDVIAGATVSHTSTDRFTMSYAVWSTQHQRLAAVGEGVIVSYDYKTGTKVDMPESWQDAIDNLENQTIQ